MAYSSICFVLAAALAVPGTAPQPTPHTSGAAAPAVSPPRYLGPDPRIEAKKGRGLLWSGLSLTTSTYFFTSLAGAVVFDNASDTIVYLHGSGDPLAAARERRALGRSLVIPVAGPFLALSHADTAKAKWATSFSGVLQLGGIVMAVVGGVRLGRACRLQRWTVTASASPEGGSIGAAARF